MLQIAVSVEGQTEERFVKEILFPYFKQKNIILEPITVITKRLANASYRGGSVTFEKAIKDIKRLLNPKYDYVTTFYDYYGINKDFLPETISVDPYLVIEQIETKMLEAINNPKFIPYIQLHEFETFLFVDADTTSQNLLNCNKSQVVSTINQALQKNNLNPELINNSPTTAPSKRILDCYAQYQKTTDGPSVCNELGIRLMMEKCKNFKTWIDKLSSLHIES